MPLALVAVLAFLSVSGVGAAPRAVTFHQDVLPILETHCTGCHRVGGLGIMPLTNYEEVRPWAITIRAVVLKKSMPPWIVEAHPGLFQGDKKLTQAEIETIARWVDGGSLEGKGRESGKRR